MRWGCESDSWARRDWRVPKGLVKEMDEAIELTRNNQRMTLVIAFNYGGRAEIVDAVKRIAAQRIHLA